MRDQETIEQACERIVRQEVLCCVSGVVNTLAKGGAQSIQNGTSELLELCDKAMYLMVPVEDWEEAATQAGWKHGGDNQGFWYDGGAYESWKAALSDSDSVTYMTADELCRCEDIEPYEWEIFEHWAVTQWFADALIEQGERVDTDFEGLCVWARTTTGQGIAMDSVIRRVVEKLRADCAALTAKRA